MAIARNSPDLQKTHSQTFLSQSPLHSDHKEALIKLVHVQGVDLRRISSRVQLKNKRGVLQDTEERIFREVLELLEQIDDLRSSIVSTGEEIRELQVTHPDIEEQVRFHGYGQRLTPQQCSDLEEENSELLRQIEQYESRRASSLEEVLHIERQKYEELKGELNDSSASPRQLEERVKQLKESISQLENSRSARVHAQYPQFDQLKIRNEELRQKTVVHLRGDEQQEARQLREYLQSQEQSRAQFMQQLKRFKIEHKRFKAQNQTLRERLSRRMQCDAKENSNIQQRSKVASSNSLDVQSYIKRGRVGDKLREYESHIRMMQNIKG